MSGGRQLLDTSTLSEVFKRRDPHVQVRAREYLGAHGRFTFSLLTRYEILRGLKAKQAQRQLERFERQCALSEVLPLTDAIVAKAADVYAFLHERGQLIGDADTLIAATALVHDLGLVTENADHFLRVPELRVESWREDRPPSEVHEPVAAYALEGGHPPPAAGAAAGLDWPPQGEWSYDDYRRLPDDGWRYEILRGVLHVSPAPSYRHQMIVSNLLFLFRLFLREHPIGRVVSAPIDVILPEVATPVQPDLVLISNEQLGLVRGGRIDGVPDLLVEVLSPSNWLTDRREKYEVYAAAGVREYWIVDPEGSSVEVFVLRQGSYGLSGRFEPGDTVRSEVVGGFEALVDEIFAE